MLWLYYKLTSAEALARDRYPAIVYAAYDQAIGNAIADLKRAPFTKTVKENITVTVQELVKQTREPR